MSVVLARILKRSLLIAALVSFRLGLLLVLPFALWGTAMAAMAPLLATSGPEFVAALRLLPAGVALLLALPRLNASWTCLLYTSPSPRD